MTYLEIDGKEIELNIKSIPKVYQINDIGEVKDRQSNYTLPFEIPATSKNIKALEMLGVIGNKSTVPYKKLKGKLVEKSIEIISEGEINIAKKQGNMFKAHIYSGNINLYRLLEGGLLSDLDLNNLNHTFNQSNYFASYGNTEGYIYGLSDFGAFEHETTNNYTVKFKYTMPQIFVHTLWSKVFDEAGIGYEGDVFLSSEFKELLFTPAKGHSFTIGDTFDFSEVIGDMTKTEFVKDIMHHFGLIHQKRKNENIYDFIKLDDLLSSADKEDWSDKYPVFIKNTYKPGTYSKSNTINYQENRYKDIGSGVLTIDNDNLKSTKELIKRPYIAPNHSVHKEIGGTSLMYSQLWEREGDVLNNYAPIESKNRLSYLTTVNSSFNYYNSSNNIQTYTGQVPVPQFENIKNQNLIDTNYSSFKKALDFYEKLEVNILLNEYDIYKLDFFKLIHLEQYGSDFYLNKVRFLESTKPSKVELIKIIR